MASYITPPRPHQKVAAFFYPGTIFTSFLYSVLDQPRQTYFSNKRNLFNLYFVKIGWLWVTVIYAAYLVAVHRGNQQRMVQGGMRYVAVSLYWYILTQWLFGPSFIDRMFVLSGGQCSEMGIFQQAVCRKSGGNWSGGHDVSGHCVMLIHASMFLWEEIQWLFYSLPSFTTLRTRDPHAWRYMFVVFAFLILSWWMLVVTGVYFHGHWELLSGTFFGLAGWAALYLCIFPRVPLFGLPSSTL